MLGEIEIDDLIDSDFGKHDYDWLLAPPETPRRAPSSLPSETQTSSTSVTRQSNLGSVSIATASKASTPQLQNAHSPKTAAKTSSLNRPSTSNLRSPSSNNNNTSRASTRNTNATTVSSKSLNPRNPSATTRPSRPTPTPTPSRPQTPATRSVPISSGPKTARPQFSRPSTSQCRRQAPTFSSPTVTSRRPSVPVTIPTSYRAALVVQERNSPLSSPKPPASMSPRARAPVQPNDTRSNLRAGAPNSPSPRTRTPVQPNDTPSNLRTGLSSSLSPRARAPVQPSNASLPHRKSLPGNVAGSSTRPNTPGTRARVSVQQIVIPAFSSDVQPNIRTTPRNSPTSAGKVRAGTASTQNATSPSSLCRHSLPIQSHSRVPANSSPRSPLRNKGNVGALAEIQKNGVSGVRKTNKVNSVVTESTELGRSKVENWLENDIKESHAVKHNADEGSYDIYESSQYDRMLMKGTSHDHNWLRTVEGKLCESCEIQRFESLPNPFGHQ